ncbi:hypothetical protein [Apilactobacillus micheneri]|uniref:hypothetical protein n=1 Tax=Apilactobacillus micheneri TaxID=1899430 RepID=UPI000D02D678|nr:hypothetical protein [Apilactobacillus micheneri]TPR37813.1 hypothetical protein DY116_00910 [Apilactobacillus micheneri]
MNILLPDIKTLEATTKIKINDTAEAVKAAYMYMKDKNGNLQIDESSNEYIIFTFTNPIDMILNSKGGPFPDIETFISCLGSLGVKFDINNTLDDNDENKIVAINFIVHRKPITK